MISQTMTRRREGSPPLCHGVQRGGRRTTDDGRRTRKGFTLVELLVVIVVLGILMALLLPAINGAVRTARNAAVSAEINQLAQALEDFKSKYGTYPPSRFLALENGNYSSVVLGNNAPVGQSLPMDPCAEGNGDITLGLLAQRSLRVLRQMFPRVSTSGTLPSGVWYDFNGNGVQDPPYILHGHECLVFFLGGVPLHDDASDTYSMTGFGKDPTNPFSNMRADGNSMYNVNRTPPLFEFNPGRLFLDPISGSSGITSSNRPYQGCYIPGYYDTLNPGPPLPGSQSTNFYVYFSSYGNGNYDPNDVNLWKKAVVDMTEKDGLGNPLVLHMYLPFPTTGNTNYAWSASPNPYTTTLTMPTNHTVAYWKPQSFQLFSAGSDGVYGLGGQYVQSTSSTTVALPFDPNSAGVPTMEASIRQREYDNLTNFKSSTLQ